MRNRLVVNHRSSVQSPLSSVELRLDEHAQFIYELALARLELQTFGAEFDPNVTLRVFRTQRLSDPLRVKRRAAYITAISDAPTDYAVIRSYNRTRSINQYLTHWFYPYKGKYHPQMVRALLNVMQMEPGDTVLDPFIGSGTTAVEAQLLGIHSIGIDASPLCALVSRVKTESIAIIDRVLQSQAEYESAARASTKSGRTLAPLGLDDSADERITNFFKVAELIAHSDHSRRGHPFIQSFVRNIKRMSLSVQDVLRASHTLKLHLGTGTIRQGDARHLHLADDSVDAILTSPPYAVTLDYLENDAHAFRALGYNPRSLREHFIGVRGGQGDRLSCYREDIRQCYAEMYRVLRPGRWCVIIMGNGTIGNQPLDLIGLTLQQCRETGFEFVREIEKPIWSRRSEMNRESITMLIKPT